MQKNFLSLRILSKFNQREQIKIRTRSVCMTDTGHFSVQVYGHLQCCSSTMYQYMDACINMRKGHDERIMILMNIVLNQLKCIK